MERNPKLELHTGRQMPALGLGTWQLTDDTAGTIAAALEIGWRLIDTAEDYGTQPGIGEGFRRFGLDRSELFLVTKIEETDEPYDATRQYLGELGLDYTDLMLIHRPPSSGAGVDLWQGLIRAREDRLVRDIGVSNYSTAQMDELIEATGEVPVVNQIEWSPFGYSEEMLSYAAEKKIVIQAYSPLTRGNRLDNDTLAEIAAKYGKMPPQVLIRWNLDRGTAAVPKANQRRHLKEDFDVFDFTLDEADLNRLSALNEHYSSLGALPYT